jgi:hypothetical protein
MVPDTKLHMAWVNGSIFDGKSFVFVLIHREHTSTERSAATVRVVSFASEHVEQMRSECDGRFPHAKAMVGIVLSMCRYSSSDTR